MSRASRAVEPLERARRAEQQQRRVAAPVLGVGELGVQQLHAGAAQLVELVDLGGRQQFLRRIEPPGLEHACAAASARSTRRAGSRVSATERRRNAAAAANPPRACARPADRSSSAATCSSGPAAAAARCHARRSAPALRIGHLGQREMHRPPFPPIAER